MIVDSHCHLDFEVLHSDLETVIERAKKNGVGVMQTICTKISEFERIYSISNLNEGVFCSIGNHPLNLAEEGVVKAKEILKCMAFADSRSAGLNWRLHQHAGRQLQPSEIFLNLIVNNY